MTAAHPASMLLLAHDLRLGWRGLVDFVTRSGGRRERRLLLTIAAIVLLAHAIMLTIVKMTGAGAVSPESLSIKLAVVFCLLFAAALDSATYALFSRGDYDLLFSAPVDPRQVFITRFIAIATSTAMKVAVYAAPFINAMAIFHGPGWLLAYPVGLALVLVATSLAVAVALALMGLLGIRRTRIAAQLTAAASGLSVFLLYQHGGGSGTEGLVSWITWPFAMPAHAMLGDGLAASGVVTLALAVSVAAAAMLAHRFVDAIVLAVGRMGEDVAGPSRQCRSFVTAWPAVLVRKEHRLILRDSWLLSQISMQCLYLVPAAGAIIASAGKDQSAVLLLPAILCVLAGQVAGSLTWIAISAEDAPELIAVAPVEPRDVTRAKVLAVIELVALVVVPLAAAIAVLSPWAGLVALAGAAAGAVAAVLVNLWFANPSRKKDFMRRRASSSLVVNALETVVLVGIGLAAALAAHESLLALPAALLVLFALHALSRLAPRP